MPASPPTHFRLVAALPAWTAEGDALTRDIDLAHDVGHVPATLRLVSLGEGTSAPVAFSATLPVHVAPGDHPAARALLSEWSDQHVEIGVVDLDTNGAVRYRATHAAIRPWSADDLDAIANDGASEADITLAPAWQALEEGGIQFLRADGTSPPTTDRSLPSLVASVLEPLGWEPIDDPVGWQTDADVPADETTPIPLGLAVLALDDDPTGPVLFFATLPVPVEPDDVGLAAAVLARVVMPTCPVGSVELVDGHVRYRLAHDPHVAPHSAETVRGLVAVGTAWAGSVLPRATSELADAGVGFVTGGLGDRTPQVGLFPEEDS